MNRRLEHGDISHSFNAVNAYFNIPTVREMIDRRNADHRAAANAAIDQGMAPLNARQASRWANIEKHGCVDCDGCPKCEGETA